MRRTPEGVGVRNIAAKSLGRTRESAGISVGRILIAGGLVEEDADKPLGEARQRLAAALGREVISRGHVVLGGCRTNLDALVASAAAREAVERKLDPRHVVKSWVTSSTKPAHDAGEIVRSRVENWANVPRRLTYPEPIREADVVIIVGGYDGTQFAASWARLAGKPIVPVASFGGAATEIFDDEISDFDRRYGARLPLDEYQILNRLLGPDPSPDVVDAYAVEVVSLAERLMRSTEVFVIISFSDEGHLLDAYDTFVRVCDKRGFKAYKVDEHLDAQQRIIPSIVEGIRRSAFIIADVSELKPNVLWELGYAQALAKDVITTAKEGTILPFDIVDVPTQYWDSQRSLGEKLERSIDRLLGKYGSSVPA
jgi:hypothetical protein